MYLLGVFSQGLFIIPLLLLGAAVYSAYRGYLASKSNSTTQVGTTKLDNTGNVPFYKTGGGAFSIIFFLAFIVVVLLMISDK